MADSSPSPQQPKGSAKKQKKREKRKQARQASGQEKQQEQSSDRSQASSKEKGPNRKKRRKPSQQQEKEVLTDISGSDSESEVESVTLQKKVRKKAKRKQSLSEAQNAAPKVPNHLLSPAAEEKEGFSEGWRLQFLVDGNSFAKAFVAENQVWLHSGRKTPVKADASTFAEATRRTWVMNTLFNTDAAGVAKIKMKEPTKDTFMT
jgi:hypothetical protein